MTTIHTSPQNKMQNKTAGQKAQYFAAHLHQKVAMKPDWEHFNDDRPMPVDPTYL